MVRVLLRHRAAQPGLLGEGECLLRNFKGVSPRERDGLDATLLEKLELAQEVRFVHRKITVVLDQFGPEVDSREHARRLQGGR